MSEYQGWAWRACRNGWGYGLLGHVPRFSIEQNAGEEWLLYCPPPPVSYAVVMGLGAVRDVDEAKQFALTTMTIEGVIE